MDDLKKSKQNQIKNTFFANFLMNTASHKWIIFILAFLIYSNTIFNKYAVDDDIVIVSNKYTAKGLKGLFSIFSYDSFNEFFGGETQIVSGGRYRPLTIASFAIENQLFGKPERNLSRNSIMVSIKLEANKKDFFLKKVNITQYNITSKYTKVVNGKNIKYYTLSLEILPGMIIPDSDGDITYLGNPQISHTINAILFALLSVILYMWIYKLFDPTENQSKKACFIALITAVIYATHPTHTEAVANIKGRDEIAVTLFSILSAYWILKSFNSYRKNIYFFGAIIAFILALFSKESAVTFLVVIPCSIYFFYKDSKISSIILKTIPFLIITVIFWFGVRNTILKQNGNIPVSTNLVNNPFLKYDNNNPNLPPQNYNSEEKLATILYTWLDYLKLLVIPYTLTSDYYPKKIGVSESSEKPINGTNIAEIRNESGKVRFIKDSIPSMRNIYAILSLLIHILLLAIAIFLLFRRNSFAFPIILYAATFSVSSNLFYPIGTLMAERFLFMPSLGYCLMIAMLLSLISFNYNNIIKDNALKISLIATVCIATVYASLSFVRNFDWYDNFTLFSKDIQKSNYSSKLNCDYSAELLKKAASIEKSISEKKELAKKAVFYSANSINIYPFYVYAWLNHGIAYYTLGKITESEADSIKKIDTKKALEFYAESFKLYDHSLNIYEKAKIFNRKSNKLNNNFTIIHRSRGNLYAKLNKNREAIKDFEIADKYASGNDFETKKLLAAAYGIESINLTKENNFVEAEVFHLKSIEILKLIRVTLLTQFNKTIDNLIIANKEMSKKDIGNSIHYENRIMGLNQLLSSNQKR